MLLGPEETPVEGFSWCRSWPGPSNAFLILGGCGGGCGGLGCGGVLSVA
jgi:hypothetical protein